MSFSDDLWDELQQLEVGSFIRYLVAHKLERLWIKAYRDESNDLSILEGLERIYKDYCKSCNVIYDTTRKATDYVTAIEYIEDKLKAENEKLEAQEIKNDE